MMLCGGMGTDLASKCPTPKVSGLDPSLGSVYLSDKGADSHRQTSQSGKHFFLVTMGITWILSI